MKHLRITVEGKTYDVTVENLGSDESPAATVAPVVSAAPAAPVAMPKAAPKTAVAAGEITSPLAGIVKAVNVEAGTKVKAGDLVITLEAMKMYTSINAPQAGTVKVIHVKAGDAVEEGQPLYTLS